LSGDREVIGDRKVIGYGESLLRDDEEPDHFRAVAFDT
jgi:hypothetical protein